MLIEADEVGLDHIGLEVADSRTLTALRDAVQAEGLELLDAPLERGVGEALRFLAPGGLPVELFWGMDTDEPEHYASLGARPRRFGHATVVSTEAEALEELLVRRLGFRLSDRLPGKAAWLRCNADHHGFGIAAAPVDGLHHYAFAQQDLAALGRAGDLLAQRGLSYIWGPGRHGPGDNLFTYFYDPFGGIVEFYADILQVDNEAAYRPREDWDPKALNLWGPESPSEFVEHVLPVAAQRVRA
jgi:catechol 2,3-dioxygenase-like lactoylglutathione lyase family enzyme